MEKYVKRVSYFLSLGTYLNCVFISQHKLEWFMTLRLTFCLAKKSTFARSSKWSRFSNINKYLHTCYSSPQKKRVRIMSQEKFKEQNAYCTMYVDTILGSLKVFFLFLRIGMLKTRLLSNLRQWPRRRTVIVFSILWIEQIVLGSLYTNGVMYYSSNCWCSNWLEGFQTPNNLASGNWDE